MYHLHFPTQIILSKRNKASTFIVRSSVTLARAMKMRIKIRRISLIISNRIYPDSGQLARSLCTLKSVWHESTGYQYLFNISPIRSLLFLFQLKSMNVKNAHFQNLNYARRLFDTNRIDIVFVCSIIWGLLLLFRYCSMYNVYQLATNLAFVLHFAGFVFRLTSKWFT